MSQKSRFVLISAIACVVVSVPVASAQAGSFLDDQWAALDPNTRDSDANGGGSYVGESIDGNSGEGGGTVVPLPSPALLGVIGLGVIAGAHRRRPSR